MMVRRALRVVLVLVAGLSIASPAHAYLDPGTGSMLVSAVIGVAAAVLALWIGSFGLRALLMKRAR